MKLLCADIACLSIRVFTYGVITDTKSFTLCNVGIMYIYNPRCILCIFSLQLSIINIYFSTMQFTRSRITQSWWQWTEVCFNLWDCHIKISRAPENANWVFKPLSKFVKVAESNKKRMWMFIKKFINCVLVP
jgi:hypothetical protein